MAVIVCYELGLHSRISRKAVPYYQYVQKTSQKGHKTAVEIKERELGEIHIFWSEKYSPATLKPYNSRDLTDFASADVHRWASLTRNLNS
jgi:hypothetical protein